MPRKPATPAEGREPAEQAPPGQPGMAARDTLRCTCDPDGRLERVPAKDLIPFQRELKSLDESRYAQLAQSMRRFGFIVPVFVWRAANGERLILDGHQRLRVLLREGWQVDGGVPVVTVEAETEREAAERLVVIASQYGVVERQGLYEFGEAYQMDLAEFDLAALPGVEWGTFVAEFYQGDDAYGDEDGASDRTGSVAGVRSSIEFPPAVWLRQRDEIVQVLQAALDQFGGSAEWAA